ncbi:MAG TPA: glycosyltransferase family 2 protein [Acidobacteriaceae bacterium]|nr:glycosyltransferase family 2 protein [Acidobacteriaceae bacterium]
MISVLILTRNEEKDLPGCLQSVSWSDDVHVFDSFSDDRTVEIARSHGANVVQRAFDGYASQRNAALRGLPFRYEWLFMLDADERPTPSLIEEMKAAVAQPAPGVNAYRLPIHYYLNGARLKHSQMTPLYLRLVRHSMVRYEREINELLKVEGETGELKHPINHYPFSKGMAYWIERHNSYSSMEAQVIASGEFLGNASIRTALFGNTFHARRAAQKALFYRMPARPLIKWFYLMFLRRAILDGTAGIQYVNLQTMYEYMIVVKTRELLRERSVRGRESEAML